MDNGFDVSIACYTFTDKPLREEFKGIHIYRRRINRFIYKSSVAALKFPIYFNWWKRYLNEVAKEQSFDIIHIHDLPLAQVGVYFKKKSV
jgi:glycogen synthase